MLAAYCTMRAWFNKDNVPEVEPPLLLKTSLPPVLMVTVLVPDVLIIFISTRDLSVGAVGKVMVTLPPEASTGTKSPGLAV